MITRIWLALKKFALPLVILYAIAITIVSLIHLKDLPSLGSSFDDKILHVLAYLVFVLFTFNYLRTTHIKTPIVMAVILVVFYGIILEALQYVLTTHRTFDLFDVLANTVGACIAAIVLKVLNKLTLNLN